MYTDSLLIYHLIYHLIGELLMFRIIMGIFLKFSSSGKLRSRRFLLYFISVNLLAAGIVGGLLYFISSSALTKETIQSNRNILLELNKSSEIMLNQMDKYTMQIEEVPNITEMVRFYETKDLVDIKTVNDDLDRMKLSMDYIDSIELYYPDSKKVFQVDMDMFNLEEYHYKDLINSVCKSPVSFKSASVNVIKDIKSNDRKMKVISLIKPIPTNGAPIEAYAVINIQEDFFRNIINTMVDKNGMEIYITNGEGNTITHSSTIDRYETLIDNDFLKGFNNSGSDYKTIRYKGEKILATVVSSKLYGWKYVSVIPYSSIVQKVSFIRYYSIAIILLAIFIGLIFSFAFSKKISGPLNSIVRIFEETSNMQEDRNVFEYIKKNVNSLIEKNASFEKSIEEQMPILRNNYINNVLNGYMPGLRELENRFKYYNIRLNMEQPHVVLLFSLEDYENLSRRYTEHQMNMLTVCLIEMLHQIVIKNYSGVVVNTEPDEIAVILELFNQENVNKSRETLESIIYEMQKVIQDNVKYSASVGIGGIYNDFEQISFSYNEAEQALNCKALMGSNRVIFYEDIQNIKEENFDYPFSAEMELIEGLTKGDRQIVTLKNREIFKNFSGSSAGTGNIFYYYMQLLSSTIKCAFELGVNIETMSEGNNLYKEILKCKDELEVYKWFEDTFIGICELMEMRKATKTHSTIDKLGDYIRNNCEKDLSLNTLASQVYMSVPYMRKLFKEQTGKSIKQYINEVRLEKAKKLLREPKYKVLEIGEMVGYDNARAFIYFFKENAGMTPSEYRQNAGIDE